MRGLSFEAALACLTAALVVSSCQNTAPVTPGPVNKSTGGADVGTSGETGGPAARFTVEFTWPGGAKGAYSIIHDDLCDVPHTSQMNTAVPELAKQNLKAGFGAIVRSCNDSNRWSDVNQSVGRTGGRP